MVNKGGVEDLTFEAKAKNSKKSKAKDGLSRTDPLEAIDKSGRDQGPRTQFFLIYGREIFNNL